MEITDRCVPSSQIIFRSMGSVSLRLCSLLQVSDAFGIGSSVRSVIIVMALVMKEVNLPHSLSLFLLLKDTQIPTKITLQRCLP